MSFHWVCLNFLEWLPRSGLLVLALWLSGIALGAQNGRRLVMASTILAAAFSVPWAIHPSQGFNELLIPQSWKWHPVPSIHCAGIEVLMAIWLLGAAYFCLKWVIGLHQLARWCRPSGGDRLDQAAQQWLKTGLSLPVAAHRGCRLEVRFVPELRSPAIWHARRTWLFLPLQACEWPESTRRRVLLHELGHVHGRDAWLLLVWRILDMAHWWNPFWWQLKKKWELAIEFAADEWVIRWCPEETREYARMLLTMAAAQPSKECLPALGGSSLESRIRRLLKSEATPNRWPLARSVLGWTAFTVVSALIVLFPSKTSSQNSKAPLLNEVELRLTAKPFPEL